MNRHLSELIYVLPNLTSLHTLEIGPGKGSFIVDLWKTGADAEAIEYSAHYVALIEERAQQAGVESHVQLGSGESLPFSNDSFDFINCCEVIEHVSHPDQVLEEMHRVLKLGGKAYVSVPSRFGFYDPHFHIYGINWMPRAWVNTVLRLLNKHKTYSETAGEQRLDKMYYDTFSGACNKAKEHGFVCKDLRLIKLRKKYPYFIFLCMMSMYIFVRSFYVSTFHLLLEKGKQ